MKVTDQKFAFLPFSKKALQLLTCWQDGSPYKDARFIVADGAVRASKTITMITSFLQWSQQYENKNFALIGKTIATLERNVIDNFLKIANYYYLQPSRSDSPYPHIKVGTNTYYLFEANNKASQDKIQGVTLQGSLLDEAALFPPEVINQVLARHSETGAKIWMNCNPESPYHPVKTQIIDKFKGNKKKIFYKTFYLDDNLTLSDDTKQELKDSFSGVFYDRNILGKWILAEGRIYDMFNKNIHVVKTEPRHYSKYYVAVDYGTQNAFVLLLFGQFQNTWYLVDEYYYSGRDEKVQKTPEEYVNEYINFIHRNKLAQQQLNPNATIDVTQVIYDPSATYFKVAMQKKGFNNLKGANNDVEAGIQSVCSQLKINKILINSSCINTIEEFETYSWDIKAGERGEDVPMKVNDHCMDAFRYFVHTAITKGIRLLEAVKRA